MSDARVVAPDFTGGDGAEQVMRPGHLGDFIGQRALCENLSVFVAAAKTRDRAQ